MRNWPLNGGIYLGMSEFFINIEHGQIVQKSLIRKRFDELAEGSYKISIVPGKRRSNKENRYYWGVVVPLVFDGLKGMGFEKIINKEDAHLVCKSLFLKVEETQGNVKIEKANSTSKLSTAEFEDYLQYITVWAFDYLNVIIPAPGQQLDIEY